MKPNYVEPELVIIKGYCGYLVSYEITNYFERIPLYNITLRDRNDPRITIVMEDIRADEIFKNTCS